MTAYRLEKARQDTQWPIQWEDQVLELQGIRDRIHEHANGLMLLGNTYKSRCSWHGIDANEDVVNFLDAAEDDLAEAVKSIESDIAEIQNRYAGE